MLKVVWGPEMSIRPHNHLMWAAIGLYGGQEDNTLYRLSGDGLMVSGVQELRTGDVSIFGDDTIHKVVNPLRTFTGVIHVYGGDLTNHRVGASGTATTTWKSPSTSAAPSDTSKKRTAPCSRK